LGRASLTSAVQVRTLIDCFSEIPGSEKTQAEVLQDNIEWAKKEKRIFLKQSLEARLIALCVHLAIALIDANNFYLSYTDIESYKQALALIDALLKELRRLDDKMILTEVHLLESRVYRGLNNFAKAKVHVPAPFIFCAKDTDSNARLL
jgi:26S proteasome regulatory subunit N6